MLHSIFHIHSIFPPDSLHLLKRFTLSLLKQFNSLCRHCWKYWFAFNLQKELLWRKLKNKIIRWNKLYRIQDNKAHAIYPSYANLKELVLQICCRHMIINLRGREADGIIKIVNYDRGMQINGNGSENLQAQRSLFSPYILFHMSCHIPILQQRQKRAITYMLWNDFCRSKWDLFSFTRVIPALLNTFLWGIKSRRCIDFHQLSTMNLCHVSGKFIWLKNFSFINLLKILP